jgi:glycosyltransferase involved in cell wall biosynthesis
VTRERRLLVLASKPKGMSPSQRYRLEQWAPHLSTEHGIELDFAPFESKQLTDLLYQPGHVTQKGLWTLYDFARRSEILTRARDYDALIIHREAALIGPAIYERLLGSTGKPIIYDFDDAIWMRQPSPRRFYSPLRFYSKIKTICRLASAVTAGNETLADYARQYNRSVSIVPSTIELEEYPVNPESTDESKFIVCWTGSSSALFHFEQAREALERLARRIPLIVKVICSRPPDRPIEGAEMRFVPWSAQGEAHEVGGCHAGIMPLPDDEYSRGKCAMKALQYMATGRPVVVSPVGVNADIVRSGYNGFLANSADEWVDALCTLANSRELRAVLGANARTTVEQNFTAAISARKFAQVVDAICL